MPLNTTGFERPRLTEIKADYGQRFTDAFGPVNTSPDAVIGQIIGIFSVALDDAYETLQDNFDSMYPYSATGTSLDGAVSFVGLERLGSTSTTVTACVYGAESTLLPTGVMTRARSILRLHSFDKVSDFPRTLDANLTITITYTGVPFLAVIKQ